MSAGELRIRRGSSADDPVCGRIVGRSLAAGPVPGALPFAREVLTSTSPLPLLPPRRRLVRVPPRLQIALITPAEAVLPLWVEQALAPGRVAHHQRWRAWQAPVAALPLVQPNHGLHACRLHILERQAQRALVQVVAPALHARRRAVPPRCRSLHLCRPGAAVKAVTPL